MKRIFVFLLACLLLVPIAPAEAQSDLPYPFFRGDGRPCSMYSTVSSTGDGQVRAVDTGDPGLCYWVSSLKIFGVPSDAEISFQADFMPAGATIVSQFWYLTPELSGEPETFWVGYPLPAGGGALIINGQRIALSLGKGENLAVARRAKPLLPGAKAAFCPW